MAKIVRLKDLEARKRALVAESEVYRQTLTLEIQNLRLYGARMQKSVALLRVATPLLLGIAGPLFGSRLLRPGPRKKHRGTWARLFGASLMGWKVYRQFGPVLRGLWLQRMRRQHAPLPSESTRI